MMCTRTLPCFVSGLVVRGFGRGSEALGIPTANLEEEAVAKLPNDLDTGIYYGWASFDGEVHKMVASVGWNPFYKNEKKTVEVHLLHKFYSDFYGVLLKVVLVGFIRPERDFTSVDELIKAINEDIAIAKEELEKPGKNLYKDNEYFVF